MSSLAFRLCCCDLYPSSLDHSSNRTGRAQPGAVSPQTPLAFKWGAGRKKALLLKALAAGKGRQSLGLNSEQGAWAVRLKGHGHSEQRLDFWLKHKTDDFS